MFPFGGLLLHMPDFTGLGEIEDKIYVHFCFRCMIDSMSSKWSRFIQSGQRNVVRFSLDAFLFHGMLGKVK